MGKKTKQKPEKERSNWIYAKSAEKVSSLYVNYNASTDSFSIDGLDINSIKHVVSHERDTGKDKVISSFPVGANSFSMLSFEEQVVKSFDYLVAIDTNTKKEPIEGFIVSACVAYNIQEDIKLKEYGTLSYLCSYVMLDPAGSLKPEPLGWYLTISKRIDPKRIGNKKIGVIVDSELGKIPQINSRAVPLFENYKLPDQLSLIYSSSDKSDHLGNQMIKFCDRAAKDILSKVTPEAIKSLDLASADKFGSTFVFEITPRRDQTNTK